MPSGLLNGRGCYDSLQKYQDEAPLFLSIRHHGTSFVLQQRKAIDKPASFNSSSDPNIEAEVKSRFINGGLPVLKALVRLFSMVFIFPLYFSFFLVPKFMVENIFVPTAAVIKKIFLRITLPVISVVKRIYAPIANVCKKIKSQCDAAVLALKIPAHSCLVFAKRVMHQLQAAIIKPPKRAMRKMSGFVLRRSQQCFYGIKVAIAWIKLLIEYGIDSVIRK
jgi:hypothetical protein